VSRWESCSWASGHVVLAEEVQSTGRSFVQSSKASVDAAVMLLCGERPTCCVFGWAR
jgi:hypothetical protein